MLIQIDQPFGPWGRYFMLFSSSKGRLYSFRCKTFKTAIFSGFTSLKHPQNQLFRDNLLLSPLKNPTVSYVLIAFTGFSRCPTSVFPRSASRLARRLVSLGPCTGWRKHSRSHRTSPRIRTGKRVFLSLFFFGGFPFLVKDKELCFFLFVFLFFFGLCP